MTNTDEPSKPRHRRSKLRTASAANELVASDTSPLPASLAEAIDHERVQLMQVQAMLKCLYEVLLYADDDDSVMHADVANVAARLIDDSVARLDALLMRPTQPAQVKEGLDTDPSRNHQVKESPAAYLC
jgi:hypothetical protein